ncbi:MAG: tRNA uridine-5-carboxymethylaminomethyl(34) synthesis GTPase MnmE [Candidatus Brocadia sp. UTAMX2]|jgi:tRNA modification GTPase|nr:MAG: tRNA uridine-5-carboxymethylaminomethyl(34) synthesis GTPase MnmE [Candidatus Brocadia sp. UTAMX2]
MYPGMQDTIVAVSTPAGRSFHAIIRISGPEAIPCVRSIFIPATNIEWKDIPSYSSLKGFICSSKEQVSIPVFLYLMKKPFSYTKEDVVEIHTTGSPPLLEILLDTLLSEKIQAHRSIRLSQPGEFTKRAFLHGRIDLAQAEATMRIIRAQTDLELAAAVEQLTGNVSRQIRQIQDKIVSLLAQIEAAIDFSDQDIELIPAAEIIRQLAELKIAISRLFHQPETGKVSPEGIGAVFYGKPNVGKSSLINALLGKRRSIVSDVPGTTRDIVADTVEIGGIRFKLTDTAGVEVIKEAGIAGLTEKVQSVLKRAQVVLLVFDGSLSLAEQFLELKVDDLAAITIVIVNKSDLTSLRQSLPPELEKYPVVYTSAQTGEGLEELKYLLIDTVLGGRIETIPCLMNIRQKDALQRSLHSVQCAVESAQRDESHEFIALDVRAAADAMGEVLGSVTTEDILTKIFSEFCIGK